MRRATVTDGEMLAVLERHVRLAIATCRARGTEPVLLGYPFEWPPHEQSMRRIAAAERVQFVSLADAFAGKVAGSARSDWFCDEIHCTAAGYQLMADLVVAGLATIR